MAKLTKMGGASVRSFDRPRTAADVLRERGKLGPYEPAKVEQLAAPSQDAAPAEPVEGIVGEHGPELVDLPEAEPVTEPKPAARKRTPSKATGRGAGRKRG